MDSNRLSDTGPCYLVLFFNWADWWAQYEGEVMIGLL